MSGVRFPAEDGRMAALYACWPAHADLWGESLEPARQEMAAMLRLVTEPAPGGDPVALIVYAASAEAEASARRALPAHARIERASYGDVWTRDTGPVFVKDADGALIAVRFQFNGWGGKYRLAGDETVAARIAAHAGARLVDVDLVCEGGALETDGTGTLMTTEECLLNPNRNRGLPRSEVERRLKDALGVTRIIWLKRGLVGDHTDGHVDNLARFIGPSLVVVQTPQGADDPNRRILLEAGRVLANARDAGGRRLRVFAVPSAGRVDDGVGAPMAASHLNWIAGPRNVVVPAYNQRATRATRALQPFFPRRRVITAPAGALLTGGGAFHCVTCHVAAA